MTQSHNEGLKMPHRRSGGSSAHRRGRWLLKFYQKKPAKSHNLAGVKVDGFANERSL
jgi:hypothetical protein